MTRASYEVKMTRGDCFDLTITYKANDVVVDLIGYSAEMAIVWVAGFTGRRGASDSVSWRAGGTSVVGAITTPTSGQIAFHMTAAETAAMPPISGATYQVRLTGPDGCITTILGGSVKVYRDLFEEV